MPSSGVINCAAAGVENSDNTGKGIGPAGNFVVCAPGAVAGSSFSYAFSSREPVPTSLETL